LAGVWSAVRIAPSHKIIVSIVVGVLFLMSGGFLAFAAVMVRDWWALIGAACVACGASGLVWAVHTKQIVFAESRQN
jgi:hypothetical protein